MANKLTAPRQIFTIDQVTKVDSSQTEELGARAWDTKGNEYIYLQGTASVVARDLVVYDETFGTTRLTANEVGPVAVSPTAIVLGQYGWFQIFGIVQVNSDDINADKSLYIDGTAGRVDDLGVSGDLIIGAYSMTASVSNVATASINYPHVSDDLGGASGGIGGPASSTDNGIARWDGTGGSNVQDSVVTVSDTGVIAGGAVYQGTAVAVAYGGTGASTAANARTNLGLAIGTDVQAYDAQLADVAGLTPAASATIIGNGSNFVTQSGGALRSSLGLEIGKDVQAYDAQLADVAALSPSASSYIVGNGSNFILQNAADTRNSLGLGTIATQNANNVSITGGSVTGITDITVADGGTGTSSIGAYQVVLGGTTDTNKLQTVGSTGSFGQILVSAGSGVVPAWQNATAEVQLLVFDNGTELTTGTGKMFFHVDGKIAGKHLVSAHSRHLTSGPLSGGSSSLIEIINTGQSGTAAAGTAMLSTGLFVQPTKQRSDQSSTAYVISTTGSGVLLYDLVRVDITEAGRTGTAKGLIVTLGFAS